MHLNQLVSVVITCYNLEDFIGSAINSVLNQDYAGPVEVIVIDDCSTDRSSEVIKSFANVQYIITERNLGVLMATVLGLERTTGEIIFFLDGDDIWESTKLSTIVECYKADSRLALVTHDFKYISSNGVPLYRKTRPSEVMGSISRENHCALTRYGILMHSDYVWLGSAYSIHRTLGQVNDFCIFAKNLHNPFDTYQDWPLAFWIACQQDVKLGYVPLKLFRYRLHGANHSGDATTVPKAIRNVRRTRNTMLAMSDIAHRFDADVSVRKVTERKLRFYTYLEVLYSNQKWLATRSFLFSLPYLITEKSLLLKELVRFLGIQFLGVERFISYARALKIRGRM